METIGKRREDPMATKLPLIRTKQSCDFKGYDADLLMKKQVNSGN
jgi:hypothetical protein